MMQLRQIVRQDYCTPYTALHSSALASNRNNNEDLLAYFIPTYPQNKQRTFVSGRRSRSSPLPPDWR